MTSTLSEKQRKMLEGKNFAFLATLNKDGSPQLTPVWVDTDGKHVLVNTAVGRVKARNVERDPRVAVSLIDQKNPYSMIAIQGRVIQQLTGKEAEDHIDKMSKKYTGREKYGDRQPGERRLLLKIEPLKIAEM